MWHKLKTNYGMLVPRDKVMKILQEVDPVKSSMRKARKLQRRTYTSSGPNASWHADGYDKLKSYGFPIHGCIDGFSRIVIWLRVCRSNNDPVVPATFYLNAITEFGLCPRLLQTDCRTENGIVAAMHCLLMSNVKAHRYGPSTSNQRIENLWSHYKRGYTSWVIDYFKDLVDSGVFLPGDNVHMECAWFVYSGFLQSELDKLKEEWNTHLIRKSRHCQVSGVPDELYLLPETRGYSDCGKPVSTNEVRWILDQRDVHREANSVLSNNNKKLFSYFTYVVTSLNLNMPPRDWQEARFIFQTIINASG